MTTLEQPIRLEPVALKPVAPEPRYTILENLGDNRVGGGLAVVSRAHDRKLDCDVAVKRLLPTMPEVSHKLRMEALMLAAVNHPNIVSIYDVYQTDNRVCIVMELLNGDTLDHVFENSKLCVDEITRLVQQTQSGLESAHSAGIVHGDLNPQNIMQTKNADGAIQYKLMDFDQSLFAKTKMPLENSFVAFGSIFCMAPERFEGTAPTHASDIYAMGCIYYHALSGQFPCTGNATVEIMASHLRGEITPLSTLRPDLPEWLCQWVHWLLARNPNERPQSAHACSESYKELMHKFTSSPKKFITVLDDPTKEDNSWKVARGNEIGGPHSWENVLNYFSSGALEATDLIKNDSMKEWVPISELMETRMPNAS